VVGVVVVGRRGRRRCLGRARPRASPTAGPVGGGGAGGGGGGGGGGGRARWGLAGHGGRPPALACAEGRRRLSGRGGAGPQSPPDRRVGGAPWRRTFWNALERPIPGLGARPIRGAPREPQGARGDWARGRCLQVQSMAVLFSRSPPEPQRRRAPAAPIWRGGARAPRNDGQSAASSAPVRLKYSNYSIPSEFSIELTTCG
ncbi:unnamed protein product, partial [Prorocentrum cordatum]